MRSAWLVAACLALAAANAHAEEAPPTRDMRASMHAYFDGELREGYVFAGAGAAGLAGGALGAFVAKDDLYKGAAWPMIGVGVIQLAAGIVLFARTDRQVGERDAMLDGDTRRFVALERPRIARVRSEFRMLEIAELALALAGLGIAVYGGAQRDHTVFGVGAGLALESALMLAFDGRASARADAYAAAIDRYAAP